MPQRRDEATAARGRALARFRCCWCALVLLGLFIATRSCAASCVGDQARAVGVPGEFVGLANFYKIQRRDLPYLGLQHFVYPG